MGLTVSRMENALMNAEWMKKLTTPASSSAVATVAMLSNLTKDAVNCYYYVTQSLNNKKIPEDKRKFVAGLDLSNGILNVVTQALLGSAVIKWSDKIFDRKIAPKFYGDEAINAAANGIKNNSIEAIKDAFAFKKNFAKCGVKVIATLVATQVVCKRIIVPLIATPMASFFRKRFEASERRKHGHCFPPPPPPMHNDSVVFENKPETAASDAAKVKSEKIPKCFSSFME